MMRASLPFLLLLAAAPYAGMPFHDARHAGETQRMPGTVSFALYDLGGEGVAYHDTEAKNLGSGGLNPADGSYLNEFRMGEGVDTSYTKFHDAIDKNPYNKVQPEEGMLYVGWTEPGEWFRMTVDVAEAGVYVGDLLYTSNRGGAISFDVDGMDATGLIEIETTFDKAEPIAWRQWHHWNLAAGLVRLKVGKGRHVLTVHVVRGGNMNLGTVAFKRVG